MSAVFLLVLEHKAPLYMFMCVRYSTYFVGIASFVRFCSDLLTPELTRRLMLPLDSALAMLSR